MDYDQEANCQRDRIIGQEKVEKNADKTIAPEKCRKNRVLVLVNPNSGIGKSLVVYNKRLVPFLESHGIEHEVFISQSDLRVHEYLYGKRIDDLLNFRSILVVSGDGLFHEAINALLARQDWQQAISVPMGLIPTGSGNGLAYTLIRQSHPHIANKKEAIKVCCEQILSEDTCLADLVKVTYGQNKTIWSFLSIGWGLLSDIDIDSEWLRPLSEYRFTIYGLLRSVTSGTYRGRLSYKIAENAINQDSELYVKFLSESNSEPIIHMGQSKKINDKNWIHIEDSFSCLYAVHQSYISSLTKFAPSSTLTDQLIYLTYIRGRLSTCQVIKFLLAIEDGSHDQLAYVKVVPVTEFKFQPLETSKVVVDGEVIPWSIDDGPLSAEIVPKMMKLAWKSTIE